MDIDSFAGIPLLISAAIGVLLFLSLLIIKLRNTGKPSFILFLVTGIIAAGSLYVFFMPKVFYFACVTLIGESVLLVYTVILAFTDPKKREQKIAAKKAAEAAKSIDANLIPKEIFQAEQEKHKRIIDMNKDLIAKVCSFFTSEDAMENFLDYCNQLMTERLKADGCAILMADDFENVLAVRSLKGSFPPPYKLPDDLPHKPLRVETNLRFAQFQLSGNIFGEIATAGEPVLIADSVKDPRVYQNGPEEFLKCGSFIFIPIKQNDAVAGVIAFSRNPGNEKFTNEDLVTAEILSDATGTAMRPLNSFLAYAEKKKLTQGGEIATKIQKDLLPQKLPVVPGLGIGCFSTASENICGDYYDVIISRKDRISFVLADVAGKGLQSLCIMLMIRAILRLIVNTQQSAATILSWANRGICGETMKIDHFASVVLVNYDSTNKTAQVSTCGTNPVFLYKSSDKSMKQISVDTEPMGVEKDTVYSDIDLQLEDGDILVACTDGVIEALDDYGAQYSADNLKKVILAHVNDSAKNISSRVKDDLKKFCGNTQQYDDSSILVIKVE